MSPTLHVRGAVLPDGTEHDLFIRDSVFTFEPADEATTILGGVLRLEPGSAIKAKRLA